jgi:hypothetical protein
MGIGLGLLGLGGLAAHTLIAIPITPLTTRATADTRSAGRRLTFRTRGNARSRGSLNSRTSLLFYFAGERDGFLARREGIARRPLRDPALRVDA